MAGCCEHGSEPSGFIKCGESVEQFTNFPRSILMLHRFGLRECYIFYCHRPQMMLAVD